MEYSNLFVVLFGIGTVFIGLICIIILITVIGYFCNLPQKKKAAEQNGQTAAATAAAEAAEEQRSTGTRTADGKLAAVLTAAAAAYVGADVADVKEIRIRRVGQ